MRHRRAPLREPGSPGRASLRLRPRASAVVWVGCLLVVAQVLLRGWALAGSWFYFDDIAFMSRAMASPITPHYLMESYGGHLMPAAFALIWFLTAHAPWVWWPWAATLLAMQLLAGLGMLRLLRSMFGDRPVVLVLLAGYLSYVFTLSAGVWFAAGINQLPMQIALVFGLHAHLAYLRSGRLRHAVVALAWTGFGLVFYEKTLLLFGIYALVAWGWFSAGSTPERLQQLWERYRPAVIAYGATAAAYLAVYAAYGLDFSPVESGNQRLAPLAWNLVGVAGTTGVVGGPLTWRPLDVGSFANPTEPVQFVSWLVVGSLVYYARQTRTMSARAWSLLVFTLAADVILLASARANIVGPDIALEYRYQTETSAFFVLSLGLAFLPLRGAVVVNETRPDVPRPYERPILVGLACLAVVAASVVSSTRYIHLWQTRNGTESYHANVASTLAAAYRQRHGPVPLADLAIPQTLLWGYRYPENTYSHVFRNLAHEASYPTSSVDSLYRFDDAGRLRPVAVPPTRRMNSAPQCDAKHPQRRTTVTLDGPVIGGGWWIRMEYNSSQAATVRVRAGDQLHRIQLPSGFHSVYFTASGEFTSVDVVRDTTADVCVTDLVLGFPEAATS
ncbi:MAG TPA: hypothetical protein VHO29_01905 [Marmoricola sp.]|nr:hypothetical protein [Marmoricola sp.]